jgi:hypothetical protein
MKMKEKKQITHDQLEAAIRKFQNNGGMIRKLPDQKSFSSKLVGVKAGDTGVGSLTNS